MAEPSKLDPARIAELVAREEALFLEKRPRSVALLETARRSLAGGVTCSWQAFPPTPLYASHGRGSRLYDVDGNEYVDLHNGYGVTLAGHGHEALVEAVRRRVELGTHFHLPGEDAVAVAEHLARRFRLPLWRFKSTGSEAVVDALRVLRAVSGRELIVKLEGHYHGSGDAIAFSYWPPEERMGPAERPAVVPNTQGIPETFGRLLRIAPYNDLAAVERILAAEGDQVAALLLEPLALNMGVVPPDEGYLAGLRELTRRHGVLLAFDEVKTGATIAWGGAIEWSGVLPDLVILAKAIGGGLPLAAIGGSEAVMGALADGELDQEGTFNGNPLSLAAARAVLFDVLTPDVYPRFDALGRLLGDGVGEAIARHELPAHALAFGARAGLHLCPPPVRNLRDARLADPELVYLDWLWQGNRGVWIPPGGDPLTLSVQHDEHDVQRYVENFESFARALRD